jgi:hypothetical protein
MESSGMSFREKSAWITLVTVLVCFGVYFSARLTGLVSRHGFGLFHLFVGCMAAGGMPREAPKSRKMA